MASSPKRGKSDDIEQEGTETARPDFGMESSPIDANHSISYLSSGPVLNEQGQPITNDHSVLTDVGGQQVWLHAERHHHDNGRVHMPLWVARDAGLPTPLDAATTSAPAQSFAPGAQEQAPVTDAAPVSSEVTPTANGA